MGRVFQKEQNWNKGVPLHFEIVVWKKAAVFRTALMKERGVIPCFEIMV